MDHKVPGSLKLLKEKLTIASQLFVGYADFPLPFTVETDASTLVLGTVLYQQGRKEILIVYANQRLRNAEKNYYNSMKLGLLALKCVDTEEFRG